MNASGPPRPEQGERSGRGVKSEGAFRTTREVAEALGLPPYVLRFWEARFPQVRPLKRAGGRRYYRPADVELLRRIRECLYQQGYTIRGVQKLLREEVRFGDKPAAPPADREPPLFVLDPVPPPAPKAAPNSRPVRRATLEAIRRDLVEIRALLDRLRSGPG